MHNYRIGTKPTRQKLLRHAVSFAQLDYWPTLGVGLRRFQHIRNLNPLKPALYHFCFSMFSLLKLFSHSLLNMMLQDHL